MNKKPHILIAEDDRGHFELIKRNLWLSYVDSDIVHFGNGRDLLEYLYKRLGDPAEASQPCILLLDIKMPGMDGKEVLKEIKSHKQLKNIPVIILTTTADQAEVNTCYRLGCSFYMVKPVNYNEFMQAVEHLGGFFSAEGIRVPGLKASSQKTGL